MWYGGGPGSDAPWRSCDGSKVVTFNTSGIGNGKKFVTGASVILGLSLTLPALRALQSYLKKCAKCVSAIIGLLRCSSEAEKSG